MEINRASHQIGDVLFLPDQRIGQSGDTDDQRLLGFDDFRQVHRDDTGTRRNQVQGKRMAFVADIGQFGEQFFDIDMACGVSLIGVEQLDDAPDFLVLVVRP